MAKVAQRLSATALFLLLIGAHEDSSPLAQQSEWSSALRAAREIMRSASYCALITLGRTGHPQARTMDPFPPSEEMVVWLATHAETRKVEQLEHDNRVTLYYFDPSAVGYVTLIGRAQLSREQADKDRFWKEEWAPFYPNKNQGEDYVLIKVSPIRLEVVSQRHGIASDPQAWRPFIIDF